MKASLKPGLKRTFSFKVPMNKTVPHLYPEAGSFQAMPEVFATGFMVGLFEWVCTELLAEHLDPGEGSLGTRGRVRRGRRSEGGLPRQRA
jgi:fluoroacetyl-CoA thioesterase